MVFFAMITNEKRCENRAKKSRNKELIGKNNSRKWDKVKNFPSRIFHDLFSRNFYLRYAKFSVTLQTKR